MVSFIRNHVNSVEQLEVLLLLHADPERSWTEDAVADELRTGPSSAATRLADLAARGFVVRDERGGFRYARPRRDHAAITELSQAYRERRYTVMNLIFSKPLDKIRVFADAFRLRREEDEGDG